MLKRAAGLLLAMLCLPAMAGEAGDITRTHIYGGTLADGLTELRPFYERGDMEGRFGVGLLSFTQGLEHFAQGLYRHGFAAPDGGRLLESPLAMPVPVNADPEPLDYDKFRGLLQRLVEDMDAARVALLAAGESGDYVVPIDLLQVRADLDGDGRGAENETFTAVLQAMFDDATVPGPTDPGAPPPEAPQHEPIIIGFDRADAIWLAGYTQVVAAQADFLLAHDFRLFFETSFHSLFPRAGLPMQGIANWPGMMMLDPESDSAIADAIAAIHTLDFPVADGERLKGVLARLKEITALSRQNWDAILAETDNDRELLPNPNQVGLTSQAKITEAQVAAWHATLDTADQILDGTLLVPHWRFAKGVDLKAYFETARRTDLVMLLTGYDALPFLRDGPVASPESFRAANEAFGDNLLGYAFWFN